MKVDGLASILYTEGKETGWPTQGNCGDCSVFTLEAQLRDGQEHGPRRIVGRDFHTAAVRTNVTDSVPLRSLSAYYKDAYHADECVYMVGVGVCCEEAHCDPGCAGHGGSPALVGYGAADKPPYLLAVLPSGTEGLSAEQMEETARLGVLLTPTVPFGKADVYARVFVGGSVASYVLTCGGASLAAAPNGTAVLAGGAPSLWQPLRPM